MWPNEYANLSSSSRTRTQSTVLSPQLDKAEKTQIVRITAESPRHKCFLSHIWVVQVWLVKPCSHSEPPALLQPDFWRAWHSTSLHGQLPTMLLKRLSLKQMETQTNSGTRRTWRAPLKSTNREQYELPDFLNNSKIEVPWVHPSTAAIANLLMSFHWQPHLNNLPKKL